jgi:hypothetical protein
MTLTTIPKENVRVPKKFVGGPSLAPGQVIIKYVTSEKKIRINRDLITQILESVGIDVGGNVFHKVRLSGGSEIFVDNAGRDLLVA